MKLRIRKWTISRLPTGVAFLAIASLLLLTGCWVSSVNGLVENGLYDRDPDITYDQTLIGAWQETSDNCTVTLTISAKDQVYDFSTSGKGDGCSDPGKIQYYRARLVKLDKHLFLDLFPRSDDVCEMCLPLHWIFLVQVDKGTLSLIPIDQPWLRSALEQKVVTLTTMPGDTDVLTASAKDLKAFCRRFADNGEVFKPLLDLTFKRI